MTDSTALRNIGPGLAYSLIAYQATIKGLKKLDLDEKRLEEDLSESWEVLAEPIQTIMRMHGLKEPYEKLKSMTRGKQLTSESIKRIIDELNLPDSAKRRIEQLSPRRYVGDAKKLVEILVEGSSH